MALDAAIFILYVFLFLMSSFLLFVIVLCCKFAIFEDDQESLGSLETSNLLLKWPLQVLM
jgi:hypothetical protein